MEIRLIGQGYNIDVNSSMADELIKAFQDGDYYSFKCLVAFASYGGVSALTPYINDCEFDEIKVIVGIDQEATSKEALEEILSWGVDSFVYHSRSPHIFHPKIYLFEGVSKVTVIVGSHNFTEFGLAKNIEASVLVSFNKNEHENHLLSQVENYFQNLLDNNDSNLKALSEELINQLYETGKLPLETHRRIKYDIKGELTDITETSINISDIFGTSPIQRNPAGFNPGRLRRVATEETNVEGSTISIDEAQDWSFTAESLVLIAQIGRGTRWKQVNFPIDIFTDFFGARRGDNSYHIELRHVGADGSFDEIEDRQAVSVASQNYRFEIGAATGAFPTNGRPIGVFVRVGRAKFLYHLVMPNSPYFDEIDSLLSRLYSGPSTHLKRVLTLYRDLKAASGSFAI